MRRETRKKQMLRVLRGVTFGMIMFLYSSNGFAGGPRSLARTTGSTAKLTVVLYAAEDSTAVVQYSASVSDASTGATLDSLGSGTSDMIAFNLTATGISEGSSNVPARFNLEQNFPNPFNPSTIIRFNIPGAGNVQLSVYDILGRKVSTLVAQWLSSGTYQVNWSPNVASGTYFYRLQTGNFSETKKMIVLDGSGHEAGASRLTVLGKATGNGDVQLLPPLRKMQSGSGFILYIYGSGGNTVPQVGNTTIAVPPLSKDTTITVYLLRVGGHVYPDNPQQIIRGFGAANIVGWRPDMTSDQIQTAFGAGPGQIGFSIMRLRVPPDSTQFNINIPSAQAATAMGVTLIATPWTPPAWMKSNNNPVAGSLNTSSYAAYAAHLKAFADTMANNGAPLYAISVQNEPDANVTYESCSWNGTQFLNFMKSNAPAVGIPVFMPESEGYNHTYSDPTLNDSAAAANTAFIGGHIYGATPSSYSLALSKGKETWMTEYLINGSVGGTNVDTTWTGAMLTAKSINDCMNANMSAYVWWYIVRYYGPIDDGTFNSGNTGKVTKKGYVMSQFARFIRPGFRRVIADASPQRNVYMTAYKNGPKVVIVVLNMGTSAVSQTFVIPHSTATSYIPLITSSTKNCVQGATVPLSGISFTAVLDASSVTTFILN